LSLTRPAHPARVEAVQEAGAGAAAASVVVEEAGGQAAVVVAVAVGAAEEAATVVTAVEAEAAIAAGRHPQRKQKFEFQEKPGSRQCFPLFVLKRCFLGETNFSICSSSSFVPKNQPHVRANNNIFNMLSAIVLQSPSK